MDVAFSRMTPGCPPFLHGPSRLSPAAGVMPPPPPPLRAEEEVQATTTFGDEEFQAMMAFSENDLQTTLYKEEELQVKTMFYEDGVELQAPLFSKNDVQLQAPAFSLDNLDEPFSEDDVERLTPLFCEEEIRAILAAQQPALNSGTPPCSNRHGGKKRKSPPWPSSVEDDDEKEAAKPSPPPPAKRARTKITRRRHYARATRRQLRAWRKEIATDILRRRFRAPEPSRGRTALRCQCAELALGADGCCACALHQDAAADRAWMLAGQGRVPLVGGPGEVLVPTASAGDSRATVRQYARWRRSVWMPTRFYVQRAVERALASAC